MPIVSVIAPGAMGAAVGARLVRNGVEVRTLLAGRSPASVARAAAAGMIPVEVDQIAQSDIVLSIVPPGDALGLVERLAPALRSGKPRLIYADCNAVSPQTVLRAAAVAEAAGLRFVDAGIIGGPPASGGTGPVFYASGPEAAGLAILGQHGLQLKVLDGPVGAASGLKMSYAGITKGLTGLAAAMMLAATRFGAAPDLAAELAQSQPELMAWFGKMVPGMYPKAYRWVAEMNEIADFAGGDAATRAIYRGLAGLFDDLAQDQAGAREAVGQLDAFLDRV